MALLLRVITKPKWSRPAWMKPEDAPADALGDLRATDNILSVWSTGTDRSDLNAALLAVASSRMRLDKLDYTLFDEEALGALGIPCIKTDGDSPQLAANGTLHRDLVQLTVQNVAKLAHMMMPLERVRVPEKQVRLMLVAALKDGLLDRSRISEGLLSQLDA